MDFQQQLRFLFFLHSSRNLRMVHQLVFFEKQIIFKNELNQKKTIKFLLNSSDNFFKNSSAILFTEFKFDFNRIIKKEELSI